MLRSKVVFCILLMVAAEGFAFKAIFKAGKDAMKESFKVGASAVSKGISLGNSALQLGTELVNSGIEKGTAVGKIAMGAGVAVAGHVLAVGSDIVVNTTGKVDSAIQNIPVLGSVVKIGNDKMRQTVSSVNKVGQTILNGMDNMTDASIALLHKATEIGTGVVSKSAKLGAAVGQATVALGTSVIQTGVDNAFTLGQNVAKQVASGHLNVSALTNNLTVGSKWIINENSKLALTNLLPVLNSTWASSKVNSRN